MTPATTKSNFRVGDVRSKSWRGVLVEDFNWQQDTLSLDNGPGAPMRLEGSKIGIELVENKTWENICSNPRNPVIFLDDDLDVQSPAEHSS